MLQRLATLISTVSMSITSYGFYVIEHLAATVVPVMYPIIFSLALNSVKEQHGSFSGILVTAIVGGAVVPLIVGGLGDSMGLRNGMLFLFLPMAYILSIGFWARPLIKNVTIEFGEKESGV